MKKIKFLTSKEVEILIIDESNCQGIKICLPSSASFSILPVREIPLIFNYSFIVRVLVRFFNSKKIKEAILFALIDVLKPKVLITHIDNSNLMSRFHQEFPSKLTISVQNSLRTLSKHSEAPIYPAPVSIFYGFGDFVGNLYKEIGIHNMEYVSAGSLLYDLFKRSNYKIKEDEYDFCYISQYTNVDDSKMDMLVDYNSRTLKSLVQICKEFGFSLAIAMRSEISNPTYIDELDYFNQIDLYGAFIKIPNNLSTHSAYKAAAGSKIIINSHSTMGFEFLGAGKKVLFAASADNFALAHSWDSYENFNKLPSINLLDKLTPESILSKLRTLISIDDDEYIEKIKNACQYYMNYSSERTISEIIKKRINKFLLKK